MRGLAVSSAERAAQVPEIPTMIESGFPKYIVTSWYGACAPTGTPVAILDKLHTDIVKVLAMPDVVQRLNELVMTVATNSRDEFAAYMRSEATRWAKVVKDAGIPPQ
jgi:tripartite-type tricarboxylate transporter receptor subunit TctC